MENVPVQRSRSSDERSNNTGIHVERCNRLLDFVVVMYATRYIWGVQSHLKYGNISKLFFCAHFIMNSCEG